MTASIQWTFGGEELQIACFWFGKDLITEECIIVFVVLFFEEEKKAGVREERNWIKSWTHEM